MVKIKSGDGLPDHADDGADIGAELSAIERGLIRSSPAEQLADRLDQLGPLVGDDPTIHVRYLIARGTVENRLGDPQRAHATALEARRIAGEKSVLSHRPAISRLIATILAWRGQGEAAMAELLRAIAEARIAADAGAESAALADAVRAAKEVRRHDLALVFLGAVLTAPALDPALHARALIDRLQIMNRLHRHEECLAAAQECASAVEATGIPRLRHLRLLEKARAHAGTGDFAAARAALEADRDNLPADEAQYEHLEWTQATVHVSAAELSPDTEGKASTEDESIFEIVERFRMDSLHRQEAESRLQLAEYLHRRGETEGALEQAAAALMIATRSREPTVAEQARSLLLRLGERPADEDGTSLGSLSDRYLLGERLGQGGYGTVRSAYDLETGAHRAIKFIDLGEITNPTIRRRMLADARAEIDAASRVRHPCLIKVHSIFVEDEMVVIVQDLINGSTLEAFGEHGADPATILHLLVQVAHAVAALHEAGIVHRDLKPNNIMVDVLSRPILIDLGLASIAGSEADHAEPQRGTRRYMAPELLAAGKRPAPNASHDIYAFGVICDHLLGEGALAKGAGIFSLLPGRGRPRRLRQLIDAMRAREPGDRPASMMAVAEALEAEYQAIKKG